MISITEKENCVGCWACYSVCPKQCITMPEDEEGFRYPLVNERECINCGLCERVCPVLHLPEECPVQNVFACINKDEQVRFKSTSGGCFSLLADKVLAAGGAVVGAAYDENLEVHHMLIEKQENLQQLRCSKYVQSRIEDCMKQAKQILNAGRELLFSGTPCQVAGFKRYLGRSYDKLFLVDVVCHGVPSPKVYREYVKEVEEQIGEQVIKVNFRDKSTGWLRSSFVLSGRERSLNATKQDSIYMKGFLKNMFVRPSCSVCRYNNQHSSADLTIADYWGVATKFPELDDDKGITVVLVNTEKGQEIFHSVEAGAHVVPSDFLHASEHNFAMSKVSKPHPCRAKFFAELGKEKIALLIPRLLEKDNLPKK